MGLTAVELQEQMRKVEAGEVAQATMTSLPQNELDNAVQTIASKTLTPDVPGFFNAGLQGRVTAGFPDPAKEAIHLGLQKEMDLNTKIQTHIQEVNQIHKNIDLLLEQNAELAAIKEGVTEFSEKTLDLFNQLKEAGIDLLKGDEITVTKERISELKSLINSQIDTARSKSQIVFVTKIQKLMSQINSLMPMLQSMIRERSKQIEKALQLPR